jgi:hypothetical protein
VAGTDERFAVLCIASALSAGAAMAATSFSMDILSDDAVRDPLEKIDVGAVRVSSASALLAITGIPQVI